MELQTLFYEVVRNFDCQVLEGFRNEVNQNEAFEKGNTQLKWPNGKHNSSPSMAVDVAPYPIDWQNVKRFYWFGGYVLGIAQRLKDEGKMTYSVRFGGNWDKHNYISDENFIDLIHYELIA